VPKAVHRRMMNERQLHDGMGRECRLRKWGLVNSVRISARDGIPYVFSRYILALPQCVFHLAIVNRRWRQQAYAGVTVLVVVTPKKSLTESTTVLDAPKAVRELRPIFHGSELALGKGIVVRHVRPTMRFRDTPYRRVREPPAWTSSSHASGRYCTN
jgi:hypothetical protein